MLSLRRVGLSRDPLGLVAGLVMVAGGNVVFHLVAGKLIGPAEYGSLSALLAILLALSVPAGAIQVSLTSEVARIHGRGRRVHYSRCLQRYGAVGLFIAAGLLVLSGPLGSYLRVDEVTAALLVGLFFPAALMNLVLRSVLLGRGQHRELAIVLVAGTIARVSLGAVALSVSPTAMTALGVTLISEALTVVGLGIVAHRFEGPPALAWDLRVRAGELVGAMAAFGGFWIVVGVDAVVARNQLLAAEAGMYAAAVIAARLVLVVPQAIVTAALPAYAAEESVAQRALFESVLACAIAGLAGVVLVLALGDPLLERALGDRFDLSAATLSFLTIASLWAGLLNAFVNFHLARGNIARANASWVGAGLILVIGHVVTESSALALVVLGGVLVSGLLSAVPAGRSRSAGAGIGPRGAPASELSVVVPVFDEGELAVRTIGDLDAAIARAGLDAEIIVVDDGSAPATRSALEAIELRSVRLIRHHRNLGKGAAIRTGWSHARGGLLAFIDGDGDIAPQQLPALVAELRCFDADGVVGSKAHPDSRQRRSVHRRLLTTIFRCITRTAFDLTVRDSQVGLKVFSRDLVADVLPHTHESGYLFDLELLAVAGSRGWRHVIEAPVDIDAHAYSTLSASRIIAAARDLSSLALRLHALRRPRGGAVVSDLRWSM